MEPVDRHWHPRSWLDLLATYRSIIKNAERRTYFSQIRLLTTIIALKKKINVEEDEFNEWDEENNTNEDKAKYWFTRDKMDKIIKVHDYLDSLPQIGKVLSFGSILRVAEDLNNKELQSLEIAVLYSKIPEAIKNEVVLPYISVEKDENFYWFAMSGDISPGKYIVNFKIDNIVIESTTFIIDIKEVE